MGGDGRPCLKTGRRAVGVFERRNGRRVFGGGQARRWAAEAVWTRSPGVSGSDRMNESQAPDRQVGGRTRDGSAVGICNRSKGGGRE